jgi:hypothetical protein
LGFSFELRSAKIFHDLSNSLDQAEPR